MNNTLEYNVEMRQCDIDFGDVFDMEFSTDVVHDESKFDINLGDLTVIKLTSAAEDRDRISAAIQRFLTK